MRIKINLFLSLIFVCTCFIHSFGHHSSARETAIQLVKKGDLHLRFGNWHDALQSYTNGIETDPEYAEAYMKRGELNEPIKKTVNYCQLKLRVYCTELRLLYKTKKNYILLKNLHQSKSYYSLN